MANTLLNTLKYRMFQSTALPCTLTVQFLKLDIIKQKYRVEKP